MSLLVSDPPLPALFHSQADPIDGGEEAVSLWSLYTEGGTYHCNNVTKFYTSVYTIAIQIPRHFQPPLLPPSHYTFVKQHIESDLLNLHADSGHSLQREHMGEGRG